MSTSEADFAPAFSVIVLAYNQQQYVRDAVRSALSQDYAPLEIVLSDDASRDATFDIMREEAAAYQGPHKIILNRNESNLGYAPHLNKVVAMTRGEWIVPAYGDDISLPHRVRAIADVAANQTPLLIHSEAHTIDAGGNPLESTHHHASFYTTTDVAACATSMSLYLGAASAWHHDLFRKYGKIQFPECYDDLVLGFRAALEQRITYIAEPLLYYRHGVGISYRPHLKNETRAMKAIARRDGLQIVAATLSQRLMDAKTFGMNPTDPIYQKIVNRLAYAQTRSAFYTDFGAFMRSALSYPVAALRTFFSESYRVVVNK